MGIRAYKALVGSPVQGLVLAPLADYSSTTVYTSVDISWYHCNNYYEQFHLSVSSGIRAWSWSEFLILFTRVDVTFLFPLSLKVRPGYKGVKRGPKT